MAADAILAARRLRGIGGPVIGDQIVRAALSVPANVAEGHGRGAGPDGLRFLRIARASASELESHLRVAAAAGMLEEGEAERLCGRVRAARYLISRLSLSLASRSTREPRR